MATPLKYGIEVEAEKVNSTLVITIALLEELKKQHPKEYKIAVKAINEMDNENG